MMPDLPAMLVEVEMQAWASNTAITFNELIEKVTAAGNVILELDEDNQRILVGYTREPLLKMERV